jgi:hypothetical protein
MKCQYEYGCVRMAADNGYDLCSFHYNMVVHDEAS